MNSSPSQLAPRQRHDKGLVLIAAYKLVQALLFAAIGVGAVRLLNKDVGDVLAGVAEHLRFNSEWHLVKFILDKASLLNNPLLRRIGIAAFSYAGLGILEGIGLYLEKSWAEYLTLAVTASFLPWEIFEILRRVTWFRSGLLVANVLIFFYLLRLVTERKRCKQQPAETEM
jgi:uncharacterized membrane protein (DUF2068 family)